MSEAVGNRREQQKQQTRARVIDAARALFAERGYDEATVRDIAQRAGVAAGSVFTTFDSKSSLLLEVLWARYSALYIELQPLLTNTDHTCARLERLAAIATEFELRDPRLFAETMGASWTWTAAEEMDHRGRLAPLVQILHTILSQGVERGDLPAGFDCGLATEIIFSCYVRNFRHALFDKWKVERCTSHLQAQIRLLLRQP